jgi:hypothetical protein
LRPFLFRRVSKGDMKTKSLDRKENGREKTNKTAGKVKTSQLKACCDCEPCPPGCCGGCCA